MPGLRLFLDVDDLEEAGGIGALEQIVGQCSALLVLMSDGCESGAEPNTFPTRTVGTPWCAPLPVCRLQQHQLPP